MPLEAQAILLNILEGSMIQHIGGRQPIKVHVRILSSTTCNLEDLVTQGRFNAKLHYWLRAFEIQVPPLRERKEDIPVISESILKRIASRLSYSLDISPEAMSLLQAYPWPTNLRELEVILERAAASLGKARRIESAQLPDIIRHPEVAMMPARTPDQSFSLEQIQLQALLQAAHFFGDSRGRGKQRVRLSRERFEVLGEFGAQPVQPGGELTHGAGETQKSHALQQQPDSYNAGENRD
jgi:DNA-binding NtrC family response regulator